ncbi:MAG: SDR family NAD(P)-dependent oxidoreductase, partial [Luteitalea sp.]|nr:SDR family NAD(P)-dependent oxidoreductase [Luteitalea sp.]
LRGADRPRGRGDPADGEDRQGQRHGARPGAARALHPPARDPLLRQCGVAGPLGHRHRHPARVTRRVPLAVTTIEVVVSQRRLDGARAIVTGGTRGIGKAIASTEASLAEALDDLAGERVQALACDVTDAAAVESFVAEAVAVLGGLDVLVNNAGTYMLGRFEDLDDADWQRTFDVNVFGSVRCARAALPHLRASTSGRIVNIAST